MIVAMSQMHNAEELAENELDRIHKSLRLSGHNATSIGRELGWHRNTVGNVLERGFLKPADRFAWAFVTGFPAAWLEKGQIPSGDGPDPDDGLPRLDSNQQPSGSLSPQVTGLRFLTQDLAQVA